MPRQLTGQDANHKTDTPGRRSSAGAAGHTGWKRRAEPLGGGRTSRRRRSRQGVPRRRGLRRRARPLTAAPSATGAGAARGRRLAPRPRARGWGERSGPGAATRAPPQPAAAGAERRGAAAPSPPLPSPARPGRRRWRPRPTPPRPCPATPCPSRAGRAPAPVTWLGCSACSEEAIFPGPANPSPPNRWNALTAVPPSRAASPARAAGRTNRTPGRRCAQRNRPRLSGPERPGGRSGAGLGRASPRPRDPAGCTALPCPAEAFSASGKASRASDKALVQQSRPGLGVVRGCFTAPRNQLRGVKNESNSVRAAGTPRRSVLGLGSPRGCQSCSDTGQGGSIACLYFFLFML